MNILVVFATTEGQTRKIAKYTGSLISDLGHGVTLLDSGSHARDIEIGAYDAVFVAASVHQESHQETIIDFVFAHHKFLRGRPSAFVSVSLAAAMKDSLDEAKKYVDRFQALTKWHPDRTLVLGGAVRFSKYDYFKQQIIKHIILSGGVTTSSGEDIEFTDWNRLKLFVEGFVGFAAT